MKSALEKSPDGSLSLTITIPWPDIKATYQVVVDESVANAEISGFRKGKAPKKMVEENLDKNKVYEETIKRLVPKAYTDAVTELKLTPIMMPQIDLKSAEEGKDWVITAKTCEKPEVTLGDYKKAVGDLKASKTKKLFIPGKEEPKEDEAKGPSVDEVLTALLTVITIHIPAILVDHEVTHQLSQLVDQTKKLGLTVEQYLASTNRTAESIRAEYAAVAQKNLSLEFALEAIADKEHIAVTDAELTKVIESAKTPEERQSLESQRYYLTSLIRRQKTLDALVV
jgi:FKBP-type peptidyl-prolyl cis-trans isomerase (trigger factor)